MSATGILVLGFPAALRERRKNASRTLIDLSLAP
jgi:hypothetical protein